MELSIVASTITTLLDSYFFLGLKEEYLEAAYIFKEVKIDDILVVTNLHKKVLIDDVRKTLYATKIRSYVQGMNLICAKSIKQGWNLNLD